MAKPKKLVPWLVCAPTPVTPELTADQRNSIVETARKAGMELSANNWKKIELARRDHVWSRSAKERAIPYQSFAGRLKLIVDGADTVLRGLCGEAASRNGNSVGYSLDTTTVLLMNELGGNEESTRSPFELIPLLHSLRTSARRTAERTQHWGEQDAWRYDWHSSLVCSRQFLKKTQLNQRLPNLRARRSRLHRHSSSLCGISYSRCPQNIENMSNRGKRWQTPLQIL